MHVDARLDGQVAARLHQDVVPDDEGALGRRPRLGPNSIEIFWLEFWLEKPLEFWLEISYTKKMFKNR